MLAELVLMFIPNTQFNRKNRMLRQLEEKFTTTEWHTRVLHMISVLPMDSHPHIPCSEFLFTVVVIQTVNED